MSRYERKGVDFFPIGIVFSFTSKRQDMFDYCIMIEKIQREMILLKQRQ
jgi:hypothetical protein